MEEAAVFIHIKKASKFHYLQEITKGVMLEPKVKKFALLLLL